MPFFEPSPTSSDMLATTPPTSDSLSNDSTQPEEPPRVYDIYSYVNKSPNIRLIYIQNAATADVAISQLRTKVLGFDLEWRPNFVKGNPENPVALVQLASEDTILLIHVSFMQAFPERLRELLLDPTVVKAGVGIQKDCKKLWTDHGVDTRNCVDLSLLARTVDNARWKGKYANPIGLSRLCEAYEELTLNKGRVQTSNWEKPLDLRQQEYAANDCHAGLVLYKRLAEMAVVMNPTPHRVWYSFDTISGMLYQPSSGVLWHPFNPYYDPGPPPPPKPPKMVDIDELSQRPVRGFRWSRNNRSRPERPLSPNASSFVPGAKEHSPSPSPSPVPSFGPGYRSHSPFPHANDVAVTAPPMLSADADGFPRLGRPAPRNPWQQQRPRSFRGGVPGPGPVHMQAARGRGRGRGGYPIAVAPTG